RGLIPPVVDVPFDVAAPGEGHATPPLSGEIVKLFTCSYNAYNMSFTAALAKGKARYGQTQEFGASKFVVNLFRSGIDSQPGNDQAQLLRLPSEFQMFGIAQVVTVDLIGHRSEGTHRGADDVGNEQGLAPPAEAFTTPEGDRGQAQQVGG